MELGEQYRHPEWQRKRLQVLERAQWRCSNCQAQDKQLHVHHKRYLRGHKVWEYDLTDLVALCERCHADHHEGMDRLKAVLGTVGPWEAQALVALLAGWIAAPKSLDGAVPPVLIEEREKNPEMFVHGFLAWGLPALSDTELRSLLQNTSSHSSVIDQSRQWLLSWWDASGWKHNE